MWIFLPLTRLGFKRPLLEVLKDPNSPQRGGLAISVRLVQYWHEFQRKMFGQRLSPHPPDVGKTHPPDAPLYCLLTLAKVVKRCIKCYRLLILACITQAKT